MGGKRLIWSETAKHFWHLHAGKKRRLDRIYDKIEGERQLPELVNKTKIIEVLMQVDADEEGEGTFNENRTGKTAIV